MEEGAFGWITTNYVLGNFGVVCPTLLKIGSLKALFAKLFV